MSVELTIPGVPVPLQRSRTSRGRHYLPKRSLVYREMVQAEWMAAGRQSLGDAQFSMSARFYGANVLADLDNLVKAVLDALNELAFDDDRQLVCLSGCHKLPANVSRARTVVELWRADRPAVAA